MHASSHNVWKTDLLIYIVTTTDTTEARFLLFFCSTATIVSPYCVQVYGVVCFGHSMQSVTLQQHCLLHSSVRNMLALLFKLH